MAGIEGLDGEGLVADDKVRHGVVDDDLRLLLVAVAIAIVVGVFLVTGDGQHHQSGHCKVKQSFHNRGMLELTFAS